MTTSPDARQLVPDEMVDAMIDAFHGDPDRAYGIGELDDFRKRMKRALTAALPHMGGAVGVPAGFKLVPEEPTQEMLDAGYYPAVQRRGAKSVWAEMLAAAPASPADDRLREVEKALESLELDLDLARGIAVGYDLTPARDAVRALLVSLRSEREG